MKNAIFFILDDYADWEFGYLASQLNRNKNWSVKTASTQSLVMSIGGFTTKVDYILDTFPESVDLLILIGGNSWTIKNKKLTQIISERLTKNQPVAAICGAVDYLASNGLLLNYKHTGNAQYLWTGFEKYTNKSDFIMKQGVRDRNLVTANGTASLEFTNLVLNMIHFLPKPEIDKTTDLYKLGFYNYSQKYGNPFV